MSSSSSSCPGTVPPLWGIKEDGGSGEGGGHGDREGGRHHSDQNIVQLYYWLLRLNIWRGILYRYKTYMCIKGQGDKGTAGINTYFSVVVPVMLTSRIQRGHIHCYVSMFYPARLLSNVQCLAQIDFSRPKDRIVKTAKLSLVDKCWNQNFLYQKFG